MDQNVQNQQQQIVEAIDLIVQNRLKEYTTTNSTIGVVRNDPINYECTVKIKHQDYICSIPEHLHSWIQKDDIVIVQDLYNDGRNKVIVGKTGQLQEYPSIVVYDPDTNKNISGVDGVFNGDDKITYAHVYREGGF